MKKALEGLISEETSLDNRQEFRRANQIERQRNKIRTRATKAAAIAFGVSTLLPHSPVQAQERPHSIMGEIRAEDEEENTSFRKVKAVRELPEQKKIREQDEALEKANKLKEEEKFADAAEEFEKLGQKDEAAKCYEKAADRLTRRNGKKWYQFYKSDDDRFLDAKKYYQKAKKLDPGNAAHYDEKIANVYRHAIEYFLSQNKFDQALNWSEDFPAIEKTRADIMILRQKAEYLLLQAESKTDLVGLLSAGQTQDEIRKELEILRKQNPQDPLVEETTDWLKEFGGKTGKGGRIQDTREKIEEAIKTKNKNGGPSLWDRIRPGKKEPTGPTGIEDNAKKSFWDELIKRFSGR